MGQRFSTTAEATLLAPSMEGNLEEVKRLVGHFLGESKNTDADPLKEFVDRKDAAGNCALHCAVFSGHLKVASFLVESCGADLTIKNGLGCTPLWIAAGYNRMDCLKYLIENFAKREDGDDASVFVQSILDPNSSGDSPFLAAASRGNIEVCKLLLASVDDFFDSSKNRDDTNHRSGKNDDIKRQLLRTANHQGDTPLKVAVAAGHDIELLNLLLETDVLLKQQDATNDDGMCINRKNNSGLSPLIVASERNLPCVVELLLKHDADVNTRDSKGRNALAVASFCGCEDVVKFLLACMKESATVASLLNGKDDLGCTPLWLASRTGDVSMVKLLIGAGADETIADKEGLIPQVVASKFKKEKLEKYFLERSKQCEHES